MLTLHFYYFVWLTSQLWPEQWSLTTNMHHHQCLASNANLKQNLQSLSDTCVGKTLRRCDCLSYCLTLSLFAFIFTQMHAHIALIHMLTYSHTDSSGVIAECCGPMLSSGCHNPRVGPAVQGKKPAFGRSYLDRLKNPCPAVYISQHTASVMVPPDTPLLYCISASFSLCPTSISFIWMRYLLCLHSAYFPFNLYFFCWFPVRL